jgi:hypothetical protein
MQGKHTQRIKAFLIMCVVLILLLGGLFFYLIDSDVLWDYMSMRDELQKCDVIFVPSGGIYTRFVHAIELYKGGYGDRIVLVFEEITPNKKDCIERYNLMDQRRLAERICAVEKMPFEEVDILEYSSHSYNDCMLLKEYRDREPFQSILAVTDQLHVRRLDFILQKIFSYDDVEIVHYPTFPEMSAKEFYQGDTVYLLQEMAKLLVYHIKYH